MLEPASETHPVVLIADDEPGVRRLVSMTLTSDAYQVVEAASGDEAWSMLNAHHPSVAVLDVRMPGRTGLELTRAIRADPDLERTRVILLTANRDDADVAAGLAAGADVYLTKPFSPLQLIDIVEDALGRN